MSGPITVYVRNDPTLTFLLSTRRTDNTLMPYPAAGATFEFFVKTVAADPDPAATAGTRAPTQDTPTQTAVTVALTAAQVGAAGQRVYHLDAITGGRRETVAADTFLVVNA